MVQRWFHNQDGGIGGGFCGTKELSAAGRNGTTIWICSDREADALANIIRGPIAKPVGMPFQEAW